MQPSTPTTNQQITAQYKLQPSAFAGLPLTDRYLYRAAYACDVLKIREIGPPYANRGADVDRFNMVASAALGSPWCAAMGCTMLVDSGVHRDQLPAAAASVHAWREWAISHNVYSRTPQRGDFGLLIFSPTEGHLTMVTDVNQAAGTLTVIAGNTNTDGSRDGYEVARKIYKISQFDGFVSVGGLA
jgi:hypothetical protein